MKKIREMQKDKIYAQPKSPIADFRFDDDIANVFEDMVQRSVPGYNLLLQNIGVITKKYATPKTNLYDLGCSLGAGTFQLADHSPKDCIIIGIDNSEAMVKKCRANLKKIEHKQKIDIRLGNIESSAMKNSSVVLMNWTLQFVEPNAREGLIEKIYGSLNEGGVLVLSEKISMHDQEQETIFFNLHERFKRENGYSLLEIDQKRKAIEQVLKTETEEEHLQRLKRRGFKNIYKFFQDFNFASFLAIK